MGMHANDIAEHFVEQLEESGTRLNDQDRRQLKEWRTRVDSQDVFDRQDLNDMRQMLESL